MRSSYAVRLAAAFAAVGLAGAVATALVVNLAFGGVLGGYLVHQQEARQQQIVSLLASSYSANGGWSSRSLDALAPSLMMQGAAVSVEDASGNRVWDLASSPTSGMMGRMMRPVPTGAPERFPVTVGGVVVGTAVIQLPAVGTQSVDVAFRDAVNRMLLVAGIAAGIAAALVGLAIARRATVPVRELTEAAGAFAGGHRAERVEYRSDDEFGAMARAFNAMADTIGEEDRLRKTFSADVAHELRTPLMILTSQIEAMQDGVIEVGPEALASLEEEAKRLARLVSDLEVLASADAAHFSLERRRTDLGSEAEAVVNEFRPLYAAKPVALVLKSASAPVEGDGGRLRQVVGNLLSNALKFTPAGGEVRVTLKAAGGHALVEVADSGPGISPDEMAHVFDRFYRGRGARAGGSGIGLSVVRDLVAAHGGTVAAANGTAGGAVFTVSLPLAAAERSRTHAVARRTAPAP